MLAVLLFFPIFLEADVHYDMNRKKFGFALYAYKVIKLIGGYVTTYPGGIALHISPKKAILKPYSGHGFGKKTVFVYEGVSDRFLFADDGNGGGISPARFDSAYGSAGGIFFRRRREGKYRK